MAGDPEVLCPPGGEKGRREGVTVVDTGREGGGEGLGDGGGELDIAVIVNQHAGVASSAGISPEVSTHSISLTLL